MINRRKIVTGAIALSSVFAFGLTSAIAAKPEVYSSSSTKVAINGYDPVAYFTMKKPVKGNASHSTKWNGASWHFSSSENLALFVGSPKKYAPQFGGYCAFAVSYGSTAPTEPEAWTIVDGKLYLNYSLSIRKRWSKDIPGNIKKANANWPGVLK